MILFSVLKWPVCSRKKRSLVTPLLLWKRFSPPKPRFLAPMSKRIDCASLISEVPACPQDARRKSPASSEGRCSHFFRERVRKGIVVHTPGRAHTYISNTHSASSSNKPCAAPSANPEQSDDENDSLNFIHPKECLSRAHLPPECSFLQELEYCQSGKQLLCAIINNI